MARIARSGQPLYQTRGRPVSWPVSLSNPDGSAIDLTGGSAVAALAWAGTVHDLDVSALGASGRFTVSGPDSLTASLPEGRLSELRVTLTDSQGAVTDYVWPVVGEVP